MYLLTFCEHHVSRTLYPGIGSLLQSQQPNPAGGQFFAAPASQWSSEASAPAGQGPLLTSLSPRKANWIVLLMVGYHKLNQVLTQPQPLFQEQDVGLL